MIDEAPLVTIQRNFPRPDEQAIAPFRTAFSSNVVDAMGGRGALDHSIRPMTGIDPIGIRIVGTVLTCHAGPADTLALLAAIEIALPGDVLLCATDAFTGTCVAGDTVLGLARNRGVAGFITDGVVRDVKGILATRIPVYCRGISPNSPHNNGPGTVGLPIVIGGVQAQSGDVVIADCDGVVIVPRVELAALAQKLLDVEAAEKGVEKMVREGLTAPSDLLPILKSDRIKYV
ncbi:RraA family protein [Sphingobium boeckii]|uniref:Putative 4-hydroxy-4-methyl-2-oxoglutarate aldolase n=1 Tax=Sphingobium boeckii TaxID=1082345 RepID=A0A7W9AHJ7_9SPHN|nr:RraA family protein [Sphingobium boeckii]MBB5685693.1 regulator of RNase E activity RraA [Sphingobium boeckii]